LFAAIASCGFPEADHCTTALTISENFARQAGSEWAGSLASGAGQMLNGMPLVEAGGMVIHIRQSLELAAEALVQGQSIPQTTQDMMARPVVPHWAYRLMGGLGWIWAARGYGTGIFPRKVVQKPPGGFCQTHSRCCPWRRRGGSMTCPSVRHGPNGACLSEKCDGWHPVQSHRPLPTAPFHLRVPA
jgi:hypothetical protein